MGQPRILPAHLVLEAFPHPPHVDNLRDLPLLIVKYDT